MAQSKKTPAKPAKATSAAAGVDRAYFAQQPPEKRALLEKLRALVMKGVPGATVSIKWGVPFYAAKNGKSICALAAFKDHVAINFFAPPTALVDPGKKLEGSGKGNRMLKVSTAADIDPPSIQRWLKAAVAAAR
ncbi:MAG TPA: DUF1801 domain-containing protein [Candidatus Limnocylindria bacterium]|jgi:hypothetical protein